MSAKSGDQKLDRPLQGIKVLDFTHTLGGFFSTMILADYGADVIKIEPPTGNTLRSDQPLINGESAYFMAINRNKRSIVVDLKQKEGKEIAIRLASEADVLVNNFRTGVMDGLGLSYKDLHALNPRLIYAHMTGYGATGDYKNRGAQEGQIQAISGVMSLTGDPAGPPQFCGINVADLTSGSTLTQGVLAALYSREKTGKGQLIEVAMLDALMFQLTGYYGPSYLADGREHKRRGVRSPFIVPYGTFEASDGALVLVGRTEKQFEQLCHVVGRAEWLLDERFKTSKARLIHRDALEEELNKAFCHKTRDEWVSELNAKGVPTAPVNTVGEALNDPVIRDRVVIQQGHPKGGKIPGLANPVKFSNTPIDEYSASPLFGQHTRSVLAELGYTDQQVQKLVEASVVVAASA
jgi:crotonobetainyl-CoA:carnitine CoA-transferase CaiB-like acyl-CoA transferase